MVWSQLHAPLLHSTTTPELPHGMPYVHERPPCVQAVPSLGATGGQPAVGGGPAHCHLGGGAMQGPAEQLEQMQMSSPKLHAAPSVEHTVPMAGSAPLHSVDIEHTLFVVVHWP